MTTFVLLSIFLASKTFLVCSSCESMPNLRAAIEMAKPGDTLELQPGVYREGPTLITKSLQLRGLPGAILDGEGLHATLTVEADDVSVEGLTFLNSGFSFVEDISALRVQLGKRCRIERNTFKNNFFAIYLGKSSDCIVQDNEILGPKTSEERSGNGIHIWDGRRHLIKNNRISGHRDGIYFEFVSDSTIANNSAIENQRYGLHFMFSNRNSYRDNVFSRNGVGVAVMYSRNIEMLGNRFSQNWGPSSYGLLLKDISTSVISENYFFQNTVGIFVEGTTRSHLERNVFKKNGWALKIYGNAESNVVSKNSFLQNTFEVSTNSTHSMNSYNRNYWSSYDGLDLNRDGVGDTAYRPVKLSSVLMERFDFAFLLIKSFFFLVADKAESVIPVMTPETLRDDNPLMRPPG